MTAVSFSAANLLPPYQDIIAGGTTDWVIYTLIAAEGRNELKLVDSGDGGLEVLEDEFSGSKVMWAFTRVKDTNSGLAKFVLINWLGAGVPDARRGLFPSHSEAIAKFLKGYHVSINARSDDDVQPALIMKRVADSSGSNYSVHNEPAQKYRAPAQVTSSYVPIGRPTIVQSRAVPPPTAVGTNYTSKMDELAEIRKTQEGLAGVKLTPTPIVPNVSRPTPTPAVQKPSFVAPTPAPRAPASAPANERPAAVGTSYTPISLGRPGKLGNRWGQAQADEAAEKLATPAPSTPAASSKPLTWSERQALAKTQREQDEATSAAASQQSPVVAPPVEAPRPPAAPSAPPMPARIVAPAPVVEEVAEPEPEPEAEPEIVDDSPPPPPVAPTPPPFVAAGSTKAEPTPAPAPARPAFVLPAAVSLKSTPAPAPAPAPAPSSGPRARVLYEYAKDEDNEMDLVEGEILTEIEMVDEGWWSAVGNGGEKRGLFPANYVELIEDGGEESAPPAPAHVEPEAEQEAAPEPVASAEGASATALYDYAADEEGELTFSEGDHISAIEFSSDTWWSGTAPDGTSGVFPSNYVELST